MKGFTIIQIHPNRSFNVSAQKLKFRVVFLGLSLSFATSQTFSATQDCPLFLKSLAGKLNLEEILEFQRLSGFRDAGAAIPEEYRQSHKDLFDPSGNFVPPDGSKVVRVLGEGMHSIVYLTDRDEVYKVARSPESAVAFEIEWAADQNDAHNQSGITSTIGKINLELGPNGSYIKRRRLADQNFAGALFESQEASLTEKQRSSLEVLWHKARKLCDTQRICYDFTSDNLWWDEAAGEWIIFDKGPRTRSRMFKYLTDLATFDDYLKIWNENYEVKERKKFVKAFLEKKLSDDDFLFGVIRFYPQVLAYADQTSFTRNIFFDLRDKNAQSGAAPDKTTLSSALLNKDYGEMNRTLSAFLSLKWIYEGAKEKLGATPEQYEQLIQLSDMNVQMGTDPDKWDALLAYMELHDLMKAPRLKAAVHEACGLKDIHEHDELLLSAIEKMQADGSKNLRKLFPSLARLDSKTQLPLIMDSMRARYNAGHLNQLEGPAAILSGIFGASDLVFSFYHLHVVADIAGVPGLAKTLFLIKPVVLKGVLAGMSLVVEGRKNKWDALTTYNALVDRQGRERGLRPLENRTHYALTRLGVNLAAVGNVNDSKTQMGKVRAAFRKLPRNQREILEFELQLNGLIDRAQLGYYFPAFLSAMVIERDAGGIGYLRGAESGFDTVADTLSSGRVLANQLEEPGVFTTHMEEFRDLAKYGPEFVDRVHPTVVPISRKEGLAKWQFNLLVTDDKSEDGIEKEIGKFKKHNQISNNILAKRKKFIEELLNGKSGTDEEFVRKLVLLYPTFQWLSNHNVNATRDDAGTDHLSFSERVFGKKFDEFDRAIEMMLFFKKSFEKGTAQQKLLNGILTPEEISSLTPESWELVFAYMSNRFLGRLPLLKQYLESKLGINSLDNDETFLMLYLLEPSLFPDLVNLGDAANNMMLDFWSLPNIGQVIQGETTGANLNAVTTVDARTIALKILSSTALVAGAMSFQDPSLSSVQSRSAFFGLEKVSSVFREARTNKLTGDQTMNLYYKQRGKGFAFTTEAGFSDEEITAYTRIALLTGLFEGNDRDVAEATTIPETLKQATANDEAAHRLFLKRLAAHGIADRSYLLYWAPHIFKNYFKRYQNYSSTLLVWSVLMNRGLMDFETHLNRVSRANETGLFTLNFEQVRNESKKNPDDTNRPFRFDLIGLQAFVEYQDAISQRDTNLSGFAQHEGLSLLVENARRHRMKVSEKRYEPARAEKSPLLPGLEEIAIQGRESEFAYSINPSALQDSERMPQWVNSTFDRKTFRIFKTTKPIRLIRIWGGQAAEGGGFLSYRLPSDRLAARESLAILREWKSDLGKYSVVEVAPGTVLYIGEAGRQSNHRGGDTQVYIANSYHLHSTGQLKVVSSHDFKYQGQ